MKTLSTLIVLILLTGLAQAFPVHRYPGLEQLMSQATDIAVITINSHIAGDGLTYDTYKVTIVSTFKGNTRDGDTTNMALAHIQQFNSFGAGDAGFLPKERYLIFFETNAFANIAGAYRNLQIIGSCWKLRADLPWQPNTNETLQTQMESLFEAQGWPKGSIEASH